MRDMNGLPAHNYEFLPVERYFKLKGERQLDYISSTGCFFRCAFCADPFVFKRRWTGLEPARMGEEIEALWHRYHFVDLAFQDETFFTYRERVIAVAEEFLRRLGAGNGVPTNQSFTWTATMRADQGERLGDDTMALCVRSGLRRVMIGVEFWRTRHDGLDAEGYFGRTGAEECGAVCAPRDRRDLPLHRRLSGRN